ncbi:MAG: hypothetical protein IJA06_04990, partial [Oscillospiraceae bacterium]|nr:hypothetical protein [Oscillospiraceae bacterium]
VRQLLPVEGNGKAVGTLPSGFVGKVGHELFPRGAAGHMSELPYKAAVFFRNHVKKVLGYMVVLKPINIKNYAVRQKNTV